MERRKKSNQRALILLHEIYGLNSFMEKTAASYCEQGYDLFCPDLLGRPCFRYDEEGEAYQYFRSEVGFDCDQKIAALAAQLKTTYDSVFLLGFSAGATIAWRVAETGRVDAAVCCYGSRIRDYLALTPACPSLLIFAENDGFEVDGVIKALQKTANTMICKVRASHGFMDPDHRNFDENKAHLIQNRINDHFLSLLK